MTDLNQMQSFCTLNCEYAQIYVAVLKTMRHNFAEVGYG